MANGFEGPNLPAALRDAMKKKRVSMTAISKHLGVSYRVVQSYLSGENRIPADFFLRVCHFLQIDADYFIYGDFRPRHFDLYDAVIGSLKEVGLIPPLSASTPLEEREKAMTLAARMTADIEARYDRLRAKSAFRESITKAPFGQRSHESR